MQLWSHWIVMYVLDGQIKPWVVLHSVKTAKAVGVKRKLD